MPVKDGKGQQNLFVITSVITDLPKQICYHTEGATCEVAAFVHKPWFENNGAKVTLKNNDKKHTQK